MASEKPQENVVKKVTMFSDEWRQEFDTGKPGCNGHTTDAYFWRRAGWGSNINSE